MSVKTSQTHPIRVDFIESMEFPVLNILGMTFAPGKKQPAGMTASWDRELRLDATRLVEEFGIQVLISLVEERELEELKIVHIHSECNRIGIELVRFPIADYSTPESKDDFLDLILGIVERLNQNQGVVVHCKGGLGRAGMTAACAAVAASDGELSAEQAIALVRRARTGTVETREQEKFVGSFGVMWNEKKTARHALAEADGEFET